MGCAHGSCGRSVREFLVGADAGHRSTQTTTRYAHLIDDAARVAVARIEQEAGV